MTDRELTHFYGIVAILITLVIALLQSQRVRSWFFLAFTSWRSSKKEKFNASIQARMDLISELMASPAQAQAYFFSKIFFLILFFLVVFFLSIMLLLRAEIVMSTIGFFCFWVWLLIVAAEPLDVAMRLRNPKKALEWFEKQKKL